MSEPQLPHDDDFLAALSRLIDGVDDDADRALVDRAIIESVHCRALYQRYMLIESSVTWARRDAAATSEQVERAEPADGVQHWRLAPIAWSIAAAALLAAGVAMYAFVIAPPTSTTPVDAPIATLIDASGDVIINNDLANPGSDYAPGTYAIASGTAQFLLTNRVTVDVRSETRLRMDQPDRVLVEHGRASFKVPKGVSGFTVRLPDGYRVVDLGTEFVIDRDNAGATLLAVVDGSVELHRPNGAGVAVLQAPQRVRWGDRMFARAGQPLEIANASFEDDGGADVSTPANAGWMEEHPAADVRTRSVGTGEGYGVRPAAVGSTWFTIDARPNDKGALGGVYQRVGTINADTLYELHLLVGERADNPTPGGAGTDSDVRWGLYTGSPGAFVPLAEASASTHLGETMTSDNARADTETVSLFYDAHGSPHVGGDLYIRIFVDRAHTLAGTAQLLFDDVRVETYTSLAPGDVPEPTKHDR